MSQGKQKATQDVAAIYDSHNNAEGRSGRHATLVPMGRGTGPPPGRSGPREGNNVGRPQLGRGGSLVGSLELLPRPDQPFQMAWC